MRSFPFTRDMLINSLEVNRRAVRSARWANDRTTPPHYFSVGTNLDFQTRLNDFGRRLFDESDEDESMVFGLFGSIEAAVARLRVTVPAVAAEVATEVVGEEPARAGNGQAKFCPQCGQPADPDDKFCAHCGYRLPQPQAA